MIHPTAIIYPNVKIGDNVEIGAYCIIGAPGESKKFWGKKGHGVEIMDNTVITGHVTIDAGTVEPTLIGSNCFIMKGVHIGHDSVIGSGVTLSPHVVIGGHCIIGERTNMGIASVVHQRVKIPNDCMIGMNSTVTKKTEMISHSCYVGSPAKWIREN
jgi:UDP-N-acetylglucosamine acyltransferase